VPATALLPNSVSSPSQEIRFDRGATSAPAAQRRGPSATTIVALLTILGLGIRLIVVRGFWLDEATSGFDSRLSYTGMIHQLLHDNHPPLDYTVLWLVAHSIGSTQTDLRLPSILFGTLTIPMLYLAGRALYHEWVGVLAAAFGTFGALAVWYAQEARMYALFMLLATVTIWAVARILADGQRRHWVIWAGAGAAMIWTQWFATLAVGTEVLILAWVLLRGDERRRSLTRLAVATASVAAVCAPGVPLLLVQFHNNQANGLGFGSHGSANTTGSFSPYGFFNNGVWSFFGYHSDAVIATLVAIWPLGILGVVLVLGRGRSRSNRILLVIIAVPMAIVFLASGLTAASRSLFEVRYFIEAVPALYLLLAGAVWTMTPNVLIRRVFAGIILVALITGLVTQQGDSQNPRLYGYNAAFTQISSVARPGDVILYAPSYLNVDVAYFEPSIKAEAVTTVIPKVPASKQIFIVGSFNFTGANQANAATLRLVYTLERTRHLGVVFNAPNVTVWEFT
jgi:uncharacterized membrane protein